MLESLMLGNRRGWRTLVDINFADAVLGSTEIFDKGALGAKYTRSRSSGVSGDGVVDVAGKGRAYYFDGNTKFTADAVPVIYNKTYRVTAAIMMGAKSGTIAGTGSYPDFPGIRPGFALHAGQYPGSYIQHFMVDQYGNYGRVLLDGAVPANAIDNIIVNRLPDGKFTIESTTRGTKNSYAAPSFSPVDSYFVVGGTPSNDNFQGHLFALKIEVQL